MSEGKITLTVISSGVRTIDVDADEYRDAKETGAVDHLLDPELSHLDTDDMVFEPDGASFDPFESPNGPEAEAAPLAEPYGYVGRWLVRRTDDGVAPIGAMLDEHLASYTALALNQAASS